MRIDPILIARNDSRQPKHTLIFHRERLVGQLEIFRGLLEHTLAPFHPLAVELLKMATPTGENYHFLDVLRSLGCKVPEEIGVACPLLPSAETELAGAIENSVEIGSVAVDFLIGMIHRQERGIPQNPQRIHVEGRWLPGKTLRPLEA